MLGCYVGVNNRFGLSKSDIITEIVVGTTMDPGTVQSSLYFELQCPMLGNTPMYDLEWRFHRHWMKLLNKYTYLYMRAVTDES